MKRQYRVIGVTTEPNVTTNLIMLKWTLILLAVALLAGALGFMALAGIAAMIAKVLFVIFLILFLVSLIQRNA